MNLDADAVAGSTGTAMLCAQCQRENPPSNAFCHTCGAPLAAQAAAPPRAAEGGGVTCPRCGAENGRNMQFCRTCGADLGAARGDPGQGGQVQMVPTPAASAVTSMALHCSRCGGQNDGGARFCKFCGSPMDAGAGAAAVGAPAPQPAPQPAAPPPATGQQLSAQVVVILRDGSEGGVYPIRGEQTDIGSQEGDIVLSDDPYMSPRHARVERRGDTFVLRDLASQNGVYVRLREATDLVSGDMFLIGQQVLRFEVVSDAERRVGPAKQHGVMVFGTPEAPRLARIAQYTTEGIERDVYYLYRDETVFGREQADVVFAEDPFLSRRHAAITMDRAQMHFTLRDLGSSNGTALRCRAERAMHHGDQFRLGRHLFRFDLLSGGHGG